MSDQLALAKVSEFFSKEMVRDRFNDVVGSREAGAYIASVLLEVAQSDALQKCTLPSIYNAALQAATLRLSVNKNTGQAYLVPFKDQCTLIVGYKGLHDMAVRTEKYRYINAGEIYEGETVTPDRISGLVTLKSLGGTRVSDKVIGWLAAFEMYTGYSKTLYMTVEEIHKHAKRYSKSYDNPKSGWQTDTAKMEKKTVLRLLLRRWGYLNPTDAAALDEVESDNGFIEGESRDADPEGSQPNDPETADKQSESTTAKEEQPESKPLNGSVRPYTAETLKTKLAERTTLYPKATVTEKQIGLIAAMIDKAFAGHDDSDLRRHAVQMWLFGAESLKDVTPPLLYAALNDWLKPVKDSGGDYKPDSMAVTEINLVYAQVLKDQGQMPLPL
jgi:recombination protein RecT